MGAAFRYPRGISAAHAKRLRDSAAANQPKRAPVMDERELYAWANPEYLNRFWVTFPPPGAIEEWQRRACVLRAWCALRLSRQFRAKDDVVASEIWRRHARVELVNAARFAEYARIRRGGLR